MFKSLTLIASICTFSLVQAETYNALDLKNGKGIRAEKLDVKSFVGNLEIKTRGLNEIIVQAKGSTDFLQTLVVETEGNTLRISNKNIPSSIKITKDDCVTLEMPSRFPVTLNLNSGSAKIEEIKADADFSIQGSGEIKINHLEGNLKSVIQGAGDLNIETIRGKADIQVSGSGDIEFEKGQLDDLKLIMSGAGHFKFSGDVKDADLTISGSGDVKINRISGVLTQNISGTGAIDIKSKG